MGLHLPLFTPTLLPMKPLVLLVTLGLHSLVFAQSNPPAPTPPPMPPSPPAPTPTPPKQPEAPKPAPAAPTATVKQAPTTPTASTETKKKGIAEFVKNCDVFDGLFRIYRDREKGHVFLFVRQSQLGPEFIYFTHTVDGVVQAGHNRGRFGNETVFTISRHFDKLEFTEQNTSFYFDPAHPLARAAKANISNAVLINEPIVAQDDDGYLIAATNVFLRETMLQVKPGSGTVLGKLSETKTKFAAIHSYPDNTALCVEYVYENPAPSWMGTDDVKEVTDPRYISVKVQHSLIKMPKNDYKPRFDDPRLGYFMTQINDMTTTDTTPWRDVIHRWHLAKQKPGTALSEPVTPITFWIENTTPVELRDTIKAAVLKWNEAFTTAGFKDAVVVKQQPDDAEWDAGDINYNVLRWTSSPNPPFGGYGPSFVNPRTGQILGADIMLEYTYITNRLRSRRIFGDIGLAGLEYEKRPAAFDDEHACMMGSVTQQGLLFGMATMRLHPAERISEGQIIKEGLTELILHEVGHTLGLNHNFRSSHLYNATDIHNRELTEKSGLTGSVMDYAPINLAPPGTKQGQYFTTKPGPYDHWVIEYGYSEGAEDPQNEAARLGKIASRSHETKLAFGNDADDMRRVGKGVDPRAMLFDMSSDPIAYGEGRCELARKHLEDLLKNYPQNGESYHELTRAFTVLNNEAANQLVAISRYVGGVYVERAFAGQGANTKPYTPVEKEKQMRALAVLAKHAFGPDAWKSSADLIAHLQQQRRGFDFNKEDELPTMHDRIFKTQRAILDHLTHPDVHQRILDSAMLGSQLTLTEAMDALTTAIIDGEANGGAISTVRQNLQSEYVDRLLRIANGGGLPAAQAAAFKQLERIKVSIRQPQFAGAPHGEFLAYKIRRGLDEK